jgi:hypothetical protein
MVGENGHEGGRQRSLPQHAAEEVGEPERRVKSIGQGPSAERTSHHGVPDVSQDAGDKSRNGNRPHVPGQLFGHGKKITKYELTPSVDGV